MHPLRFRYFKGLDLLNSIFLRNVDDVNDVQPLASRLINFAKISSCKLESAVQPLTFRLVNGLGLRYPESHMWDI